jgi:hypothetical protein
MPNPIFQVKEEFYKSKTKLIENEILQLKRRQEREEEEYERKKNIIGFADRTSKKTIEQ